MLVHILEYQLESPSLSRLGLSSVQTLFVECFAGQHIRTKFFAVHPKIEKGSFADDLVAFHEGKTSEHSFLQAMYKEYTNYIACSLVGTTHIALLNMQLVIIIIVSCIHDLIISI